MAKILLVGYGYWGKIWYKTLKKSLHELVAVVDSRFTNGQCIIDTTLDSEENISNVKKEFTHVIVATPADTHLNIYKQLKALGIKDNKILIEKPIGCSLEEAEIMKDCCHDLVWLYDKTYREVKNIIRSGRIGNIKLIQSFRASMGPRIRTDVIII